APRFGRCVAGVSTAGPEQRTLQQNAPAETARLSERQSRQQNDDSSFLSKHAIDCAPIGQWVADRVGLFAKIMADVIRCPSNFSGAWCLGFGVSFSHLSLRAHPWPIKAPPQPSSRSCLAGRGATSAMVGVSRCGAPVKVWRL